LTETEWISIRQVGRVSTFSEYPRRSSLSVEGELWTPWLQGKGGGPRAGHNMVVGEGGNHPVAAFLTPRRSVASVWTRRTVTQNPEGGDVRAQLGLQ
jgi:hypothetical protein